MSGDLSDPNRHLGSDRLISDPIYYAWLGIATQGMKGMLTDQSNDSYCVRGFVTGWDRNMHLAAEIGKQYLHWSVSAHSILQRKLRYQRVRRQIYVDIVLPHCVNPMSPVRQPVPGM